MLTAAALDWLLGDPPHWPHPVRYIAKATETMESWTRKRITSPLEAGILTTITIIGGSGCLAWLVTGIAWRIQPVVGFLVAAWIGYTALAARDLFRHVNEVQLALSENDLPKARASVAKIVGRDTANMNKSEVARAAIESLAESFCDGVAAPLFWFCVAGPAGAMAYRAANTLDSMVGHKDERYREFGWAAARLDDLLNWIPARLAAVAICAAALGGRSRQAWNTWKTDGDKHASPNAGQTEAAMAGALGVSLGGPNYYDGELHDAPRMGKPEFPIDEQTLGNAMELIVIAYLLLLAAGAAAFVIIGQLFSAGLTRPY